VPISSVGQRHVPAEEDPDPGSAGRLKHPSHSLGYLWAVGELAHDADLHVIDDQGEAIRVADVRERFRGSQGCGGVA
jgi:hypothetical protein